MWMPVPSGRTRTEAPVLSCIDLMIDPCFPIRFMACIDATKNWIEHEVPALIESPSLEDKSQTRLNTLMAASIAGERGASGSSFPVISTYESNRLHQSPFRNQTLITHLNSHSFKISSQELINHDDHSEIQKEVEKGTHNSVRSAEGGVEDANASPSLLANLLDQLSLAPNNTTDLENGDNQSEDTVPWPSRPLVLGDVTLHWWWKSTSSIRRRWLGYGGRFRSGGGGDSVSHFNWVGYGRVDGRRVS